MAQSKPVFQLFKKVAIFGSADISERAFLYDQTFRIASSLVLAGLTVVNGGGPGVMEAATAGAESVGGSTIVVTFHPVDAPMFEGQSNKNKADVEIKTTNYPDRLIQLTEQSDAYVIMKGGTGTLSEWATVWLLAHIYYGKHKPFVLVGGFWREIIDVVQKNMFIDAAEMSLFRIVDRSDQVVPALLLLERERLLVEQNFAVRESHV